MPATTENTRKHVVFLNAPDCSLVVLQKDYLPDLFRAINNPALRRHFPNSLFPMYMETEEEWLKGLVKDKSRLVTGIVVEDELIGTMGLHAIDRTHRTAITGAMIWSQEHQGQHYGRKAKMVLLHHAFNYLNLRKVFSQVKGGNERSLRYSLACGYVEEAVIKDRFEVGGEYYDEIVLGITREQFAPKWQDFCNQHHWKVETA